MKCQWSSHPPPVPPVPVPPLTLASLTSHSHHCRPLHEGGRPFGVGGGFRGQGDLERVDQNRFLWRSVRQRQRQRHTQWQRSRRRVQTKRRENSRCKVVETFLLFVCCCLCCVTCCVALCCVVFWIVSAVPVPLVSATLLHARRDATSLTQTTRGKETSTQKEKQQRKTKGKDRRKQRLHCERTEIGSEKVCFRRGAPSQSTSPSFFSARCARAVIYLTNAPQNQFAPYYICLDMRANRLVSLNMSKLMYVCIDFCRISRISLFVYCAPPMAACLPLLASLADVGLAAAIAFRKSTIGMT